MLAQLAEQVQLCAALDADNRRARIQRLLWKFQLTVDLKPLVRPEVRAWVETWLEQHPLAFESRRIRNAFVRTVARDSGGIPAAVVGMLELALVERSVNRATLRDISHEAARAYLDMTPALVIVVAGFMALRYVSRGVGAMELMVLAGVATSFMSVLLFFVRRLSSRR